jgi:hypothetical protein
MSFHPTISDRIITTHEYSSAMRHVGDRSNSLRAELRHDSRMLIPVAELARKFDISTRLLWKWIQDGLLKKRATTAFYQKHGVTKTEVIKFLKRLEEAKSLCFHPGVVRSRAGRHPKVIQKMSRVCGEGKGMNPREFARLAGVSRSSVLRAIKMGDVPAWNPTPHRWIIGTRSRTKKAHETRKNVLTRRRP